MEKKIHFSAHEDITIFYDMYLGENEINDYLAESKPIKVSDGSEVTAEEIMNIVEENTHGIDSDIEITEKDWESPHKLYEDSFSGYLEDNILDHETDREYVGNSYECDTDIVEE